MFELLKAISYLLMTDLFLYSSDTCIGTSISIYRIYIYCYVTSRECREILLDLRIIDI